VHGVKRDDARARIHGHPIRGFHRGRQAALKDRPVQQQNQHGAQETRFLADHRIDEVGMALGQEAQRPLTALAQPASGESAGPDGDDRLDGLVSGALRIAARIGEDKNPLLLVVP